MRILLVLLMVFNASGDDEMTVYGVLKGRVLLPCSCPNINLDKELKWQMEQPKKTVVYKKDSGFFGRYNGSGEAFLTKNNSNCSILLTNITQSYQGKYKCIFHIEEKYTSFYVYLNISGRSSEHHVPRIGSHGSASAMSHFQTTPIMAGLVFSLFSEMFI